MNLLYCFVGVLVGTLVGVLPGVGTLVTMAVLLPLTFGLPPIGAVIMLAGIYYGAQYGGSTTAILVNMPGESASAVTCIDGYKMARQGRAGPALATAALASFFAGCVGTIIIAALAKPIASLALLFRAPEYFFADRAGAVLHSHPGPPAPCSRASPSSSSACCLARSAPTSRAAWRASRSDCQACRTASTSPLSPWVFLPSARSSPTSRRRWTAPC